MITPHPLAAVLSQPAAPRPRVLLFDEHAHSRDARTLALKRAGFDVVCASAVDEARFLYRPGRYSLVLADFTDRLAAMQLCSDLCKEDGAQLVGFLVGIPPYLVLPRDAGEYTPDEHAGHDERSSLPELMARVRAADAGDDGHRFRRASRLISLVRSSTKPAVRRNGNGGWL